jgi:adenosylmethionine-8-amino-7-oxononanoate aminotransferase
MTSLEADRKHAHWHGFTQMAEYEPLEIVAAEGCFLTTHDGRRLFDGVSSLWCNVHGHRHPRIDAAIQAQLNRVAHVTSLGMSAEITERLARKLAEITPGDLAHVFFSSDGSSSIEAAIKMAIQYWQQRPDPRPEKTRYLALGAAYHGDTTGGVSLGDIPHFHQLFAPILFAALRGPTPCSYRLPSDVSPSDACHYYTAQFASLLEQHHRSLAAVVMEPRVQGAAGMITHPPGLLTQIRRLCDHYEVLLICDEVATGFGRTGKLFACEHESVTPDILCVGKGLTAGYLPMAATIARPPVYEAFLAPTAAARQFFHGHTFGGNPLAAAAALASIELLETTPTLPGVRQKAEYLRARLAPLADHPQVGDVRGLGLMVGIELVADRDTKRNFDATRLIGRHVCRQAIARGVWIRPLGDVLILMPPMVASESELDLLATVLTESIETLPFVD